MSTASTTTVTPPFSHVVSSTSTTAPVASSSSSSIATTSRFSELPTPPLPHPLQFIAPPSWPAAIPTVPSSPLFGIDHIVAGRHGLNLSGGFNIGAMNAGASFNSPTHIPSALTTPNVTNLVTVKLFTVDDYLMWKTQFMVLLISHNLLSFVDGSSPLPQMYLGTTANQ